MGAGDAVNLTRFQSAWTARYEEDAQRLSRHLSDDCVIEHIGSTAVPGLAAKDCIDILVVVKSPGSLAESTLSIEKAGYEYRPGSFPDDAMHRFFRRKDGGRRTHHVHLLVEGSQKIPAYRAFRDLLRSSPTARSRYEAVKRRLAEANPDDRAAYIDGKASIVAALTAEALAESPPPKL